MCDEGGVYEFFSGVGISVRLVVGEQIMLDTLDEIRSVMVEETVPWLSESIAILCAEEPVTPGGTCGDSDRAQAVWRLAFIKRILVSGLPSNARLGIEGLW